MKKIKLTGKLALNKETIARLNDEQMNAVKGGVKPRSKKVACASEKTCFCRPK